MPKRIGRDLTIYITPGIKCFYSVDDSISNGITLINLRREIYVIGKM
jgi:hypothetical protein